MIKQGIASVVVVIGLAALVGCAGTKLQGKVVSCADQQPIDGAKLTVAEVSSTKAATDSVTGHKSNAPPATAGDSQTLKDGSFTINVLGGSNPSYTVKAEKDGFATVESDVGSGQPAAMCMKPMK